MVAGLCIYIINVECMGVYTKLGDCQKNTVNCAIHCSSIKHGDAQYT